MFRTSLRQLDAGARNVLASVSAIRTLKNSHGELLGLEPTQAHCALADGDEPSQPLIGEESGALGIDLKSRDVGTIKGAVMVPILRAPDGSIVPIQSFNFADQLAPSGAIVCLSADGNWLLTWVVQSGRQQAGTESGVQPPFIQRIIWIRTGPVKSQDNKWHAELTAPRAPGTAQSYDDLTEGDDSLNRDYPRLYEAVRQRRPKFYSFRRNDNVGFLIPMSDDRTAMMWTTTALLDPDPVKGPLKEALADCESPLLAGLTRQARRRCTENARWGRFRSMI